MLTINKKLFKALQKANIQYCHWKSNEHLKAGLQGKTDLDILIAKNTSTSAKTILQKSGFQLFSGPDTMEYKGLEHWIGMDAETKQLSHIHLHDYLRLGQKHLKGYILPWESLLLNTATNDPATNITIADPNLELILLLTRSALKIRCRDYPLFFLGQIYFSKDDKREFNWLQQRSNKEKLRKYAQKVLGKKAAQHIVSLKPSLFSLTKLRRIIKPRLHSHKQHNLIDATLQSWKRELIWITHKINQRYFHQPTTAGLRVGKKGKVIACIGTDGSGKSTITNELTKWLSWKFNPIPIYFGSGQGTISLLRLPLKLLASIFTSNSSGNIEKVYKQEKANSTSPLHAIKKVGLITWALLLAREKRIKLKKMIKARNRGMIIICDRFPQKNIQYLSDGPLLMDHLQSKSSIMKKLARWEFKTYELAFNNAPDLVLRLNVSPNIAVKRKSDITLNELQTKSNTLKTLQYGKSTKIVDIDANMPLQEVINKAKNTLWKEI
jgi:thymidylate kinase